MENYSSYQYDYDYDYVEPSYTFSIPDIVTYSVVLYIGLCANIWMLWSLYKTWETGSRSHFYLLALCISDIVALCIKCPLAIGTAATIFWRGGEYGCKIIMPLSVFGSMVAHFILAGFNVDNLVTVVNKRSIKAIRIAFLICAISLTFVICIPQMFLYVTMNVGYQNTGTYCVLRYDLLDGLLISIVRQIQAVAIYWLPLLLMLFGGGPALCVWYGRKDEIPFQKMAHEDGQDTGMKTIGKDIGMVIAYDILFMLCWTPMVVSYLVFTHIFSSVVFAKTIYTLMAVNSCVDPFIYAVFTCIYKRRGRVSPEL